MKTARITAILAVAAAAPLAAAGTDTADLNVSATVSAVCNVTTTALDFGTVNPLTLASTDHTGTGTVNVNCSSGTAYTVALGNGDNYDTTNTARQMTDGSNMLTYELYSDAGHATAWNATTTVAKTESDGVADALTVYGLIPAGQNPPNGAYSDTVTVTVTF